VGTKPENHISAKRYSSAKWYLIEMQQHLKMGHKAVNRIWKQTRPTWPLVTDCKWKKKARTEAKKKSI